MTDMKRFSVSMPDGIMREILAYQENQGLVSISEAVRSLVTRGLTVINGKQVQADAPQTNSG